MGDVMVMTGQIILAMLAGTAIVVGIAGAMIKTSMWIGARRKSGRRPFARETVRVGRGSEHSKT